MKGKIKRGANSTKQNQKSRTQQGITLIALVITIIVLLILAGVAINLALDANGLFGHANRAVTEWNNGVAKEEQEIGNIMGMLDEMTREKTLVELYDAGELKIGDYVNYNPIATGDAGTEGQYKYTSEETSNGLEDQNFTVKTDTKWRVLGVEGEGSSRHIVLISADPVARENTDGDNYFHMYGARAYLNYITELNNISAIYGHGEGAESARSVTIDDINKIAGVTVDKEGYTITPDVNQNESYGQSYNFPNHYLPENWKGSKENSTQSTVTGKSDGYWYEGNAEGLQTNSTTNPTNGARLYEMLFEYTGEGDDYQNSYWLASRGVRVYPDYAYFGPGHVGNGEASSCRCLFRSYGGEYEEWAGVRPVVSLKSNVTESTIHKIEDQPRTVWEDPAE